MIINVRQFESGTQGSVKSIGIYNLESETVKVLLTPGLCTSGPLTEVEKQVVRFRGNRYFVERNPFFPAGLEEDFTLRAAGPLHEMQVECRYQISLPGGI